MKPLCCLAVAVLLLAACAPKNPSTAPASGQAAQPAALRTGDEGMWTLANPPLRDLKQRYDFEPSAEWLRHVQLGAVRFNDGGSGAFVSADGLVITNHHVALGQLQKMSSASSNFVRDGFYARSRDQEKRCPDLELNVLVSTENVTERVVNAMSPMASDELRNKQRKSEMARIEKESTDATHLRSDVIELYQGGEYWLYRYQKYTDVRLVMAPEIQAAFYGGDFDNFTYPRFCLDFAFFRVYENDQPARIQHYFKWSPAGAKDGELVFVAGHPGSTDRLRTLAQLRYERDHNLPTRLMLLARQREALKRYATLGTEQARQVQDRLFSVENSIKALTGRLQGLKDRAVFDRLEAAETQLRQQVASRPELRRSTGKAWERIGAATSEAAARHEQLAWYPLNGPRLTGIALQIVRLTDELKKPNEKRYEEYRDSAIESLELRLFSPAPIYPQLDEHLLADVLAGARDALGPQDPLIAAALDGREPQAVAHDLIAGTQLANPAFRRELVKGGAEAVAASTDPLIVWARRLDPIWRSQRDWVENNIQSVTSAEGARIARARFAIYGHETYPDANFTLRLSFGRVAGYEWGTTRIPPKTTFWGLFDRAASFEGRPPFDLSRLVAERRARVDANTPLDFVTTNDIIGGNSGSPVLNRAGEYVGLIFDGNIQGLAGCYIYTDTAARAIAVHSSAILEALRNIYDMPELVKELDPASGRE